MSKVVSLQNFLKALEDKDILSFNKNLFNNRLKVQKYIFIARKFGVKLPYKYSLYIRGPYSSSLADDYYKIENFQEYEPLIINEDFFNLVRNKTEKWLEYAATLIMIRDRYAQITDEQLIRLVKSVKPHANNSELIKILNALKKYIA